MSSRDDYEPDDYARGYTQGHAAGRQAAFDGEEPRGYGQALRDMTARALAAEAALERAVADADAQIVAVARESEARGRLHGLLAAAMAVRTEHKQNLIELNTGGSHLRHYWFGTLDEDDTLLNVFAALASEATDGPA